MRNGLCKIPTDLSQKYDFPELAYCQAVLKEQKRVVKQIDEALGALKKAYQAQAATIGPLSNISYRQIALESGRFRHFVEARQQLASQFSKYSVDITNLRASKVAPLRSSLSERYKGIVADIAKMRSSMSEPIEKLTKEVKSHEKSIAGVVAAALSRQQSAQQQLSKEVMELDERLTHASNAYLLYRKKFGEFWTARENVLTRADAFLADASKEIRVILDKAWEVDATLFEPGKKDTFVDSQKPLVPTLTRQPNPPRSSDKFMVFIDGTINVGGGKTISDDEEYELVKADGDIWRLKDKRGAEWDVPAIHIVPKPRRC